MNRLKLFCLWGCLLITHLVFGTAQFPDVLTYQGKKMALLAFPINQYPDQSRLTKEVLFGNFAAGWRTTACWRGHIMCWEFDQDSLFLTKIINDCYEPPKEGAGADTCQTNRFGCQYADLQKVFGAECKNGRVFAYWVVDTLLAGMGRVVHYVHDGLASSLKYERDFVVENGILKEVKEYDNSRSVEKNDYTVICSWGEVYRAIDWDKVENLGDRRLKMYIRFSANEQGVVDSVEVARSCGVKLYDEMALKWVENRSGMSVRFKRGRFVRVPWVFPVVFSEEMRRKAKEENNQANAE